MIKRALDAGAHGVMVPMCHSAADAARVAGYCRYPPRGSRGYGPMYAPHSFPGLAPGPQYDGGADDSLLLLVQLESRAGVEDVENIAAVDGVDVLFIGEYTHRPSVRPSVRLGEGRSSGLAETLKPFLLLIKKKYKKRAF